jgi:hypothetical protein
MEASEYMNGEWVFDRLHQANGGPIEINEAEHDYMLCVLPPVYKGGYKGVGEPYSHIIEDGREVATRTWFGGCNGSYWAFLGSYSQVCKAVPNA